MLAEERYEKILKDLSEQNLVKSSDLVKLLNVSTETIRRDLERLEKDGLVKRVYGGAVLNNTNGLNPSFGMRNEMKNKEKDIIAHNAIKFINEGNSIALDNGTTTLHLASLIKGNFTNLIVITNSLVIANMLYEDPHIKVILLGGVLDREDNSLGGSLTESNIELFHIDKAFISVSGISLNNGATDFDFNYISIQKKLLNHSKEKFLLADSGKFNNSSLLKVCDLEYADYIITDSNLSECIYNQFYEAGHKIIK